MEVTKSVLEWREGDPITSEHRDALAADIARAFHLSADKEAETRRDYAKIPDVAIAEGLAVMIAQHLRMNVAVFKETFPTIAREGKSMSVQEYLRSGDKIAAIAPDEPDLGDIG